MELAGTSSFNERIPVPRSTIARDHREIGGGGQSHIHQKAHARSVKIFVDDGYLWPFDWP